MGVRLYTIMCVDEYSLGDIEYYLELLLIALVDL